MESALVCRLLHFLWIRDHGHGGIHFFSDRLNDGNLLSIQTIEIKKALLTNDYQGNISVLSLSLLNAATITNYDSQNSHLGYTNINL